MKTPEIDPRMATDLDAVKRAQIEKEVREKQAAEAAAAREQATVEQAAREWERGMNRAFKGIMTRPQRRRMFATRFTDHEDEQVTS
jgi:hypothetical protein